MGQFMFAGLLLADLKAKDHVELEVYPRDPQVHVAFELAGQGKIPKDVLRQLSVHKSVVYAHFPADFPAQRGRILHFVGALERAGGIAVKVESCGVAHTWDRWNQLLSGTTFDCYCAVVTLIGDEHVYYSCGMHHYGLPDCEVTRSLPPSAAADLMNRFNFWRVAEQPVLQDGETFSMSEGSPRYSLSLWPDRRHEPTHPFHNPQGVWHLSGA